MSWLALQIQRVSFGFHSLIGMCVHKASAFRNWFASTDLHDCWNGEYVHRNRFFKCSLLPRLTYYYLDNGYEISWPTKDYRLLLFKWFTNRWAAFNTLSWCPLMLLSSFHLRRGPSFSRFCEVLYIFWSCILAPLRALYNCCKLVKLART